MKDLDIQVGDRVTFIYENRKVIEIAGSSESMKEVLKNIEVLKIERIGSDGWHTVYEKEDDILDEKEKEYLSAVIKPFKNRVQNIVKLQIFLKGEQFIRIHLSDNDACSLPNFERNTMYKNMTEEKRYTLKELGLE